MLTISRLSRGAITLGQERQSEAGFDEADQREQIVASSTLFKARPCSWKIFSVMMKVGARLAEWKNGDPAHRWIH
jgi:hypothetical protein